MSMVTLLLDLLFPPKCMFCGRILDSGDDVVCGNCLLADLPEVERELPAVPCFEKSVASFWYEEPVISAIVKFKFHGMAAYGVQFGRWLAPVVRDHLEDRFDLISWVPCSRRRIWSRGFDQARLLAEALGRELHVEVVQTLKKVKHNPKQSQTVGAARRRANVLNVYRPFEPERFRGKRILLVDDVLTTGATLSECGKTLLLAGAGELYSAVVAAAHGDHNK